MKKKMTGTILTALFAAFISAGAFIQIPLSGGVPIVLQDMMAMLSGLLLGPLYGGLAVLLFLLLGSIGLPVFSGKAGIHIILQGPTGGFLVGYLLSAIIGGLVLYLLEGGRSKSADSGTSESGQADAPQKGWAVWLPIVIAALVATIVVFVVGILGFMRVTHAPLAKTLTLVLYPFIPGNAIKLVAMVFLVKRFRPLIKNYL